MPSIRRKAAEGNFSSRDFLDSPDGYGFSELEGTLRSWARPNCESNSERPNDKSKRGEYGQTPETSIVQFPVGQR
jgi:hypothetical protein